MTANLDRMADDLSGVVARFIKRKATKEADQELPLPAGESTPEPHHHEGNQDAPTVYTR